MNVPAKRENVVVVVVSIALLLLCLGSAKQCNICQKVYVSMPALSMHILTHNLNHRTVSCQQNLMMLPFVRLQIHFTFLKLIILKGSRTKNRFS